LPLSDIALITNEIPAARPLRVLLVEDDLASALLVAAELENVACEDISVMRADRLSSALERLAGEGADCVLLDLSLPDAQGIEGVLRLTARFPGMPVVVLTGTADEGVGLEAVAAGAEDFLIKGGTEGRGVARAVRYAVERRRAAGLAVAKEELERRIAERDRAEHELRESRRMLEIAQEARSAGSTSGPRSSLTSEPGRSVWSACAVT
jgi:CheY-like chemotaxis protein